MANGLVERGGLGDQGTVARIVFRGEAVFAKRGFQLIAFLKLPPAIGVGARGGDHRPLQRDRVVRIPRVDLHGPAVRDDGLVEIAGPHRALALLERLAGGASTGEDRHRQQNPGRFQPSGHKAP